MTTGVKQRAEAYIEREEEIADLRGSLARTLRQLDHANASKQELVDAVRQAATDAIAGLHIPKIKRPPRDKSNKTGETAIIALSDWQLAKKTPTYSTAVCEKRIELLADKVVELTDVQRSDHPIRECRIYLLGDIIEGEMIFPGQAHRIDASLFRQVLTDGPRILGTFIRRIASEIEKVHVVGVIGNHGAIGGRARRDYHPETNADAMLYEVTRMATEGPTVTWASNIEQGERKWNALDTVGSKTFFLFHGDQVRNARYAGIPWYGFKSKILGWSQRYKFDYALSGHFHTPVRGYYDGIWHWGNGSTESENTYAIEALAVTGQPSQQLLFSHPKRGVTADYVVTLGSKTSVAE